LKLCTNAGILIQERNTGIELKLRRTSGMKLWNPLLAYAGDDGKGDDDTESDDWD